MPTFSSSRTYTTRPVIITQLMLVIGLSVRVVNEKERKRWARARESRRQRREIYRGAKGAEEGGVWGGGIPLPSGGGVWALGRRLCRLPEFFFIFCLAMVHFDAFKALVLTLV